MDPPLAFGDWLQQRRKALALTREQLAQRVGCSVSALRKLEGGERRPSLQVAELLANALDLAPEARPTFLQVARGELNVERLPSPTPQVAQPAQAGTPARLAGQRLPVNATPLIGRQAELAELGRLLADPQCQLLTLVGPGGVGKTRLAIRAARQFGEFFADGAAFVSLAALTSPGFLVPAIAEAIGFSFSGPADPQTQLAHHLSDKHLLLVLDNVEHLLAEGAAEVLAELHGQARGVTVLVTSRETLNCEGEWVFEVPGLPVPPVQPASESDEGACLEAYGAVELFLQRGRRAHVGFAPAADDYPAIVRICQRLEGMPLGIELAAAWTRTLSCGEILQQMESGLDFLAVSARDLPARHRSMRAVFDHSWSLLSEDERRVLRRLTVFQGGFRREAAERVAGATLALLSALIAKSLLRRAEAGRYDLHEVIRQYASSHLDDDPQGPETRDRHSDYYLALVRDREQALRSATQQEAVRELMGEMDNVRAAWDWAIERGRFVPAGQAVRSLGWFFEAAGLLREGIEQLERLVQVLKSEAQKQNWHRALGQAQAQQGLLYFRRGHFDRAQELLEESLAVLRPLGEAALLTDALIYLGVITHLNGALDRAQSLIEEGMACAQAGGDAWFAAYARYNQGYLASLAGRHAEGCEQMLAGLATWRALGDPQSIALGLNFLVPTLIKLGRYAEAHAFMQESLELCARVPNRWGMGTAYRFWGMAHMAQGNLCEAQALFRKSLEVFEDYTVGWDIARTLSYLGEATLLAGDLTEARRIYLEALHISIEAKVIPIALEVLVRLAQLHARVDKAEQALELAYQVLNHPAATQDARDLAFALCQDMEAHLSPQQIESAQRRARLDDLEQGLEWLRDP
jgi:predicted ATPase/transcriptional regulator with XRE-family HTH domain